MRKAEQRQSGQRVTNNKKTKNTVTPISIGKGRDSEIPEGRHKPRYMVRAQGQSSSRSGGTTHQQQQQQSSHLRLDDLAVEKQEISPRKQDLRRGRKKRMTKFYKGHRSKTDRAEDRCGNPNPRGDEHHLNA